MQIWHETMSFFDQGQFSWTLSLQTNASTDNDGCAEWTYHLSPASATADELIICVTQHQSLFDKWDWNYKNNNLSIKQQMPKYRWSVGWVGSCRSIFSEELLASVKGPDILNASAVVQVLLLSEEVKLFLISLLFALCIRCVITVWRTSGR